MAWALMPRRCVKVTGVVMLVLLDDGGVMMP